MYDATTCESHGTNAIAHRASRAIRGPRGQVEAKGAEWERRIGFRGQSTSAAMKRKSISDALARNLNAKRGSPVILRMAAIIGQ